MPTDWTPDELEQLTCKAPGCHLLITLDNDLCAHHAEQRRRARARAHTRRRAGAIPASTRPC